MTPSPSGRHLEAFIAVAENGGLSQAARMLNLAQSTVSRQIEQIEESLGCALVVRSSAGTQLTQAGELFYGYATRVLADLLEVRGRIDSANVGEAVRLASVTGPLYTILPSAVRTFERENDIRILVRDAATDEICAFLRSGRIDLGIVNLPVGDGLEVDILAESQLALVVPRNHPLAGGHVVALNSVRDEPFILLREDQTLHRLAVSACYAAGFSPRVAYYTRDTRLCVHLVGQGAGVSIVPRTRGLERLTRAVRLLRLDPPFRRRLAAVCMEPTATVRRLITHLKSNFSAYGT